MAQRTVNIICNIQLSPPCVHICLADADDLAAIMRGSLLGGLG